MTAAKTEVPDSIEKKIVLRASRARVWDALTDAKKFGVWFGVDFAGPFVPGQRLLGRVRATQVDAAIAKEQEPYVGKRFEVTVDAIEPQNLFSFFWHPYALEEDTDYSSESMTRVTFALSAAEGGTLLVVTESGFSKVPLARRAEAFTANEGGWEAQTKLIAKYLELHG